MEKRYYNTTNLKGLELLDAIDRAESQEQLVLEVFTRVGAASPSEICRLLNFKYPITSMRRAITNLTKFEYLEKTEKKKKGFYNSLEYVWRLKK
jgi:hypothetical protein